MLHLVLAALLQAPAPAAAEPDPQAATVFRATEQMAGGKPADALNTVEPALAAYEQRYGGDTRRLFCTYSPAEVAAAMAPAATGATAIGPGWCDALFIKAFSLIDLHRVDEGLPLLERAVAMAPHHAHFINELGYAYQAQRDWQRSFDTYKRAADATRFSPWQRAATEKGRALRGMGYALIEQGKWDEAEALFNECLRIYADDAKAKNELQYIAQQRRRPRA